MDRVPNVGWHDWLPPAGWKCQPLWEDPGDWATIDVSAEGLRADDKSADASEALKGIVRRTSGNRVLYFPPGNYWFRTPCSLQTGGVVIRGAGAGETHFY